MDKSLSLSGTHISLSLVQCTAASSPHPPSVQRQTPPRYEFPGGKRGNRRKILRQGPSAQDGRHRREARPPEEGRRLVLFQAGPLGPFYQPCSESQQGCPRQVRPPLTSGMPLARVATGRGPRERLTLSLTQHSHGAQKGILHISRWFWPGLAAQRVTLGSSESEEGPAYSPHLKGLNQSWTPRRNRPSTVPLLSTCHGAETSTRGCMTAKGLRQEHARAAVSGTVRTFSDGGRRG